MAKGSVFSGKGALLKASGTTPRPVAPRNTVAAATVSAAPGGGALNAPDSLFGTANGNFGEDSGPPSVNPAACDFYTE
jgi:hypothetical protein